MKRGGASDYIDPKNRLTDPIYYDVCCSDDVFYFVLGWVGDWLTPVDPYRAPSGQAVKAFQPESTMDSRYSPAERLRLYYWYGE